MYILTIYSMSLHTMRFPVSAKSSCCCCSLFKNLIVNLNFHFKNCFVHNHGDVKKITCTAMSCYLRTCCKVVLQYLEWIKDRIKFTCVPNKISKSNSLKLNSKYLLLSDANVKPLCIFLIHILTNALNICTTSQ